MERETVCRSMKTNPQKCWWRGHDSALHLKPEWCFGGCRIKEVEKNIYFAFYWCFWTLSSFKSRYSRVIHRKPLSIKKPFLLDKVTEKMTLKMIRVLSWLLKTQTPQVLLTKLFETTNSCFKFSHFCCAKERGTILCGFFHLLPFAPCFLKHELKTVWHLANLFPTELHIECKFCKTEWSLAQNPQALLLI